jgi:hypothetical protein
MDVSKKSIVAASPASTIKINGAKSTVKSTVKKSSAQKAAVSSSKKNAG